MTFDTSSTYRHLRIRSRECFNCKAKVTDEHINEDIAHIVVAGPFHDPVCSNRECQVRRAWLEKDITKITLKRLK